MEVISPKGHMYDEIGIVIDDYTKDCGQGEVLL